MGVLGDVHTCWKVVRIGSGTMEKKNAVLVDIDGTLVTVTPNWSAERNGQWEVETMNSTVLNGGVELIKKFKDEGYVLVFLTARGQGCRKYTEKKLREIGVWSLVDSIWHRPKSFENVSSSIYKKAMIERLSRKYEFVYAMDDEDKNIQVMASFGMEVFDAKRWW